MGSFWHGFAMRLYRAGIGLAAACGHAKARGWLAMRKGRIAELSIATSGLQPGQQWMWFHCASVGEYEQARPVMEAWRPCILEMRFCFRFTVLRGGMRSLDASRNG